MTAAIELRAMVKRYGALTAVDRLTLTVDAGSCFGLIGPNGAGKTTTFSVLCGFLFADAGEVRVMGADPATPGALKGRVGVLPQDALLPAAWPLAELLTYWARLGGAAAPPAEAARVLARVGLTDEAGKPAGALSHGMAKRAALAQALLGSPPLVLLDEPTAGLDPRSADQVRQLVREMRGDHTVVVSSHNLHELEELCDAAAILDRGQLVSAATMRELTSAGAEVRILIARGATPTDEWVARARGVEGIKEACARETAEGPEVLLRFDAAAIAPEAVTTAALSTLIAAGARVLAVTRGHRLEQRVLELAAGRPPGQSG